MRYIRLTRTDIQIQLHDMVPVRKQRKILYNYAIHAHDIINRMLYFALVLELDRQAQQKQAKSLEESRLAAKDNLLVDTVNPT